MQSFDYILLSFKTALPFSFLLETSHSILTFYLEYMPAFKMKILSFHGEK
jgi:hypothetical protein